jgi:hypothetical protein
MNTKPRYVVIARDTSDSYPLMLDQFPTLDDAQYRYDEYSGIDWVELYEETAKGLTLITRRGVSA